MGLMSKILGESGSSRVTDDYVELSADDLDDTVEADQQVRIARIGEKQDVVEIKDAVYDGDIVVADITRLNPNDSTIEHILDDLRQVAREVDGDIVQKGDDQIIIVPTGFGVGREKLSSRH